MTGELVLGSVSISILDPDTDRALTLQSDLAELGLAAEIMAGDGAEADVVLVRSDHPGLTVLADNSSDQTLSQAFDLAGQGAEQDGIAEPGLIVVGVATDPAIHARDAAQATTAGVNPIVLAMRAGASDFLTQPLPGRLETMAAIERGALQAHQRRSDQQARAELQGLYRKQADDLRALELDQKAGRQLQVGMLPPSPLRVGELTLAHRLFPSLYLSGDFIDYFEVDGGGVVFFIADVSGHGASSAFVTVLLKNFAQRLREPASRSMIGAPDEMLHRLNAELLDAGLNKHVAIFLGVIDPIAGRLTYANAGHFPPPMLVSGKDVQTLEQKSKPAGLFARARYAVEAVELPLGSFKLVLFSDGVLELLSEPTLAEREQGLIARVCAAQDVDALCAGLGLGPDVELPDDVACLVIER